MRTRIAVATVAAVEAAATAVCVAAAGSGTDDVTMAGIARTGCDVAAGNGRRIGESKRLPLVVVDVGGGAGWAIGGGGGDVPILPGWLSSRGPPPPLLATGIDNEIGCDCDACMDDDDVEVGVNDGGCDGGGVSGALANASPPPFTVRGLVGALGGRPPSTVGSASSPPSVHRCWSSRSDTLAHLIVDCGVGVGDRDSGTALATVHTSMSTSASSWQSSSPQPPPLPPPSAVDRPAGGVRSPPSTDSDDDDEDDDEGEVDAELMPLCEPCRWWWCW